MSSSSSIDSLELVVVVGDELSVIPLPERGALYLGRDRKCDVYIDNQSVSRRHARLNVQPGLSIEDLDSRNGTFVGEKTAAGDATQPLRRLRGEKIMLTVGERVNLATGATIVVRHANAAKGEALFLDPEMKALHAKLRRAARGQINILLLGETGVGKEVFAREAHAASPRAGKPFIALDCSTLPPALADAQLFGSDKGSFTGADRNKPGFFDAADTGTLFLDEVGELPLEVQAKFLRVLESRTVIRLGNTKEAAKDVRIIAATNRDLHAEAGRGAFRLDLLHRLDSMSIEIPPLRRRPSEIEPLAQRFLLHFARMLDCEPPILAPETLELLRDFAWPGNVRELRNAIEHAVTLCQGGVVLPEDLPVRITRKAAAETPRQELLAPAGSRRDRIIAALEMCAGNQTRAAEVLQISRRTLVNWMQGEGLPRPRKKSQPAGAGGRR